MSDDSNIVRLPPRGSEPLEFLIGPFKEWHVQVEGRLIPRLTGFRDGDKIAIVVDGRFSHSFAKDDAYQAAWLIANAMAIAEGYSHLGSEKKDQPFAPLVSKISSLPSQD